MSLGRNCFEMWKFLLGILVVAFGSFCGRFLAKKYRQRKLFFSQLCAFNERFLTEISYYRRPIREFAIENSYHGEFNELIEEFLENMETASPTDRNLLGIADYVFLNEEEKKMIEDYFLMLGKGDSSSQKGYFSSIKDSLSKRASVATEECKRYGDLYLKIGFLCGLLVLILII